MATYDSCPTVTYILPTEWRLTTLAENVGHGVQTGQQDALLGRPTAHVHPVQTDTPTVRPVSRTRSSADPQPTFTLYRQTHRQSDRSAGRAPRPTHSPRSPCTDRHTDSQTGQQDALLGRPTADIHPGLTDRQTDSQTGQQDALLGRPTAHVHPVQTDRHTDSQTVSRTRSSADPQPTFTLDRPTDRQSDRCGKCPVFVVSSKHVLDTYRVSDLCTARVWCMVCLTCVLPVCGVRCVRPVYYQCVRPVYCRVWCTVTDQYIACGVRCVRPVYFP